MAAERHHAAFVVSAVLGGLAGAGGALFWAPQAGAETRAQLVERWHDANERLAQGIAALDARARDLLGQDDGSAASAPPPADETAAARSTAVVEIEPAPPGPRPGPIVGGTVVSDATTAMPGGPDGSGTVPPRPPSGAGAASG